MKNSIFKWGLFLTLGLTALCSSCQKDDSGTDNGGGALTITATNVINNYSTVFPDSVMAVVYDDNGDDYTIAKAQFKNNGFTLTLPATVPDAYLSLFNIGEDKAGLTISDKTAKVASLNLYDSSSGGFDYASGDPFGDEANLVEAMWIYTDKNVTVTGSYKDDSNDSYKFNLTFKKGWNVCYYTTTITSGQSTFSATSQMPSGTSLKWYYYSN